MRICSIDPGIVNLGLCVVQVDERFQVEQILRMQRVNLTNFRCGVDCTLHHSGNIVDAVLHFLESHREELMQCDLLLLEQQPPGGAAESVQAMLYMAFRHKALLVSPVSMHKHFAMSKEYDVRKAQTVALAKQSMEDGVASEALKAYFGSSTRAHDISDAFAMVLFHTQRLRAKLPREAAKPAGGRPSLDSFRCLTRTRTTRPTS